MQRNNRLGCLTSSGILAAVVTALVIVGVALAQGNIMFSAGALNAQVGEETLGGVTSHAEIGGQCSACHAAPWGADTMASRCQECHAEIADQLSDPASLHGAVYEQGMQVPCRACHPEHRGPDAPLTELRSGAFPHESLGYSLQGHQRTADGRTFLCEDCHGEDITTFDPATCDSCHRQMDAAFSQAHRLWVGEDCLACHDGVDTYGKAFDHNDVVFKLEGGHAEVPCSECHLDARSLTDLQSAPQDCFSCHSAHDPHAGRFGQDCSLCHSPKAWEPANFDHNLAAFKLEGEHAEVACEQCHKNDVFKGTPTDCYSCHSQDDEHDGRFGTDCAACHTPEDWDKAVFDHSRSAFPLTGAHVNVECERCHVNGVFKGTATECVACHAEPEFHAGQFGTDCAACHSTSAWTPAEFNGQHTFPLNHGGGTTCQTCHPTVFTEYTCYGCHEHNEARVRAKHLEEGISNFQDCVRCHPTGREEEGERGGDD